MRILLLDIETAPNLAYVWGLFNQNISINQISESGYTLCYAAKWLHSKPMMFDSIKKSGSKKMIRGLHKLLEEADAVIHYNGRKFDMPVINREFVMHKLKPPSPYKQIDMLSVCRGNFRFTSNKLDYVSQVLGLGAKVKHAGHELWVNCMAGDEAAWKMMEKYNKGDVIILERLYHELLPWIKNHPNYNLYHEDLCCPNCESENLQARGYATTAACVYKRYQCQDCGKWFRGNDRVKQPKIKGKDC